MKNSRENRMETLKAANIETGKYFSAVLPEGFKAGDVVNFTIDENGIPVIAQGPKQTRLNIDEQAFVKQVFNDGYVKNTRLHRRWVMAQMFRMLNYKNMITGKSGYDAYLNDCYGYQYQFEMMLDEVFVLSKLYAKDSVAFKERSVFFTPDVVIATCEDYMRKLRKYIEELPVHKCKGIPYKKILGKDVFVSDIYKKVLRPQEMNLLDLKAAVRHSKCINGNSYDIDFYHGLRKFCSEMYKLPSYTPKCAEWKNAFKGEGSYYTLMNLIKFHGCRVYTDKYDEYLCEKQLTLPESIEYVNEAKIKYNKEYYRLFALLKKVIKDNHFDFKERMQEIYSEK